MSKNTLISIVGGFILVIAISGLVYYLRARNIASLSSTPPAQTSAIQGAKNDQEKNALILPAGSVREDVSGTETDMQRYRRYANSQYTEEEWKVYAEVSSAEANLPDDLTKTWTPEFRARVEAQQQAR